MILEVVLLLMLKGTDSFAESFTCNQNDIGSIFVRLSTLSKEIDDQIRNLKENIKVGNTVLSSELAKTNRRIDQLKATMDTIKENIEKINKILETNECTSNPCVNHATCVDGINRYSCRCMPGYEGTNCQIEINECASNPCVNHGTCLDGINRFSCRCMPGYNGTNCQNEIDECASKPCVNNGTCVDGINRYTCRCMPGYNGTNCQFAKSSECKNPSSSLYCNCVDECPGAIDEAICECENGYSNEFVTIPKKVLGGWNILDQIVSSAVECQKLCINTEGCLSCELDKSDNRCWINNQSPITKPSNYEDAPTYDFFARKCVCRH